MDELERRLRAFWARHNPQSPEELPNAWALIRAAAEIGAALERERRPYGGTEPFTPERARYVAQMLGFDDE